MKKKPMWFAGALIVLFAVSAGAVFAAPPDIEGAWKQELRGSAWGVWAFKGNKYVYYIMDVEDRPDEAGTFTTRGDHLVLQPTQKLSLDGKYASYTRKFELRSRRSLFVANTKGKMDEYRSFRFDFPDFNRRGPPPKNDRR